MCATILTRSDSDSRSLPTELQTLRSKRQEGGVLTARYRHRATQSLDATDSRLETINAQHSDMTLQPEDVEIFRDFAVHNLGPQQGMRRPLSFTLAALEKLGRDFQKGRMMNVHHNGQRQVGATFGATLKRETEVRGVTADWLAVDWYAPSVNASEQRMQDITDMRTGVLRYTSIEFGGGDWTEKTMETPNGKDFYFEIDTADGEAFRDQLEAEGMARVALGAVRGAGSEQ